MRAWLLMLDAGRQLFTAVCWQQRNNTSCGSNMLSAVHLVARRVEAWFHVALRCSVMHRCTIGRIQVCVWHSCALPQFLRSTFKEVTGELRVVLLYIRICQLGSKTAVVAIMPCSCCVQPGKLQLLPCVCSVHGYAGTIAAQGVEACTA
jgi:hypothetical protein